MAKSVDVSFSHLPFAPMDAGDGHTQGNSLTAAVGTSAANVTLPVGDEGNNELEIVNASTGNLDINFGDASVAAVTAGNGFRILPSSRRIVRVRRYVTTVSCLTSVAGNVTFTRGCGMT